jgi:nitroreductase
MMLSIEQDAKRLCKKARKKGRSVATFSQHYRATLYSQPWRLIIVAMPPQSPARGEDFDPNGVVWNLGAAATAAFVGNACLTDFQPVKVPELSKTEPRLAWAFEERKERSIASDW